MRHAIHLTVKVGVNMLNPSNFPNTVHVLYIYNGGYYRYIIAPSRRSMLDCVREGDTLGIGISLAALEVTHPSM